MSRRDGPLLVIGVGNVLLRDDGVGVQVVHALGDLVGRGEVVLPPDTSIVDGGTIGRDLVPWLADTRALLLIDAVEMDAPPGTVKVTRGEAIGAMSSVGVATHRTGVSDLLETARVAGVLPDAVALVGVRPAEIDVGLELSDAVRAAMPAVIEATVEELHRLAAIAPSRGAPAEWRHGATGATA